MEQFEKLRERLNDALAKIDSAMEAVLDNKEDANLSSSLMSENLGLKSQVKALESELESLRKDNIAHIDMESLSTELAALRAEREEEKKELQTLYDQLSSALSEEGRAD
jgi:dynactin complex subunit